MTWNETSPDAIPYERLIEGAPTATLNGGPAGTTPISALVIQGIVDALRADTANVATDLSVVETLARQATVIGELSPDGGQEAASRFSGLDSSYTTLILTWKGQHDGAANTFERLSMRFNGDSGSNYQRLILRTATDSGTFTPEVSLLTPGLFTTAHGGSVGDLNSGGFVIFRQPSGQGQIATIGVGCATRGFTGNVSIYVAGARWLVASTITSVAAWPGNASWTGNSRLTLLGLRA